MKTFIEMNDNELHAKYNSKAADSFKTKFDLYVFYKWLDNPDTFNNSIINSDDFDMFQIFQELIDYYTTFYWQELEEKSLRNGKSIKETYPFLNDFKKINNVQIDELKKHYIENFHEVFTFEDFKELVCVRKDLFQCHYCGIDIEMINELIDKGKIYKKQATRGFTLEIDRIRPNEEYKKNNCVLCCYWCNNAKTDEFNGEEFKRIGEVIGEIWKERNL